MKLGFVLFFDWENVSNCTGTGIRVGDFGFGNWDLD